MLSIDIRSGTSIFREIEDISGSELANRLENRLEVLVSGRDLLVPLKAALLQDAVERPCFVHRLATAVDKGEDFQDIGADLTSIMTLLLILEVLGKENLGGLTVGIVKRLPGWSVEGLSEVLESDIALT